MSVEGVRYAHSEGRVSLVHGRDGKKVYTLGMDGEIRVWAGIDDDDVENIFVGEEGFAVAVSNDRMFVATSETNSVQALNLDGDNEGTLTKFTADVTCLDTLESGEVLVSGSADMTIKVTDTKSFSDKVLIGHSGPILSVSLDPRKKFVASSSCDGTVRVWEVGTKEQLKSFDCVPKSNDVSNSKTICGIRFSSSGAFLAVPKTDSISVLQRDSWIETKSLKCEKLEEKEILTCVAWRKDESMIVAGTSKGNLCVWSLDGTLKHFLDTERKYSISAISWNPKNLEEVGFADSLGFWGLAGNIGSETAGEEKKNEDVLSQEELVDLFNDDDDDDENSFSISKIQAETGFAKDEEGHLIHGERAGIPSSRPTSAASSFSEVSRPAPRVEQVKLQSAFQPGASPDHFTFRFLVYNRVGIVKTIQDNCIDVDFHNSDTHYNLFFRNPDNYTLAALTDKVLVLGREGDEETTGKISVNNFKSHDQNKDWVLDLPEGEYVDGVAAGEGWVAVTTSKNYVRLFTAWGIQREIISVSGPLVSMVGSGDKLFIVTHFAHPLPKQQNFAFYTISINFKKGLSKLQGPISLPITPDTELYWIGLSDTKLPLTMDTAGVIRMHLSSSWYPICDTKSEMKGKSDTFYITGVDQLDNEIYGVKCRGSRYPQTLPKPTPSILPMQVPFCITGERGGLEQRLLYSTMLAPVIKDEEQDVKNRRTEMECLMKIFALACRSEQESRAIEVCKLMPDVESIQMAIQYAAKIKRVGLASKLGELAMQIQDTEAAVEEEDEEEEEEKNDDDSQDMFGESQDNLDNPLLGVRPRTVPSHNTISNSRSESRNPFAKKNVEKNTGSLENSPNSGISFDSSAVAQKPLLSRKPLLIPNKKKMLVSSKQKENKVEGGELKGFSLYHAENREEFPGTQEESQQSALEKWKSLDKSDKEKYKSPRIPVSSGKRKRSTEAPTEEKKPKSGFSSKLSGFAFGGN